MVFPAGTIMSAIADGQTEREKERQKESYTYGD